MSTEAIDADGDIIVNCADKSFLVSFKALSLASPVFNAMFQSHFKEGKTLRTSTERPEFSLPDDDPGSFRLFCYIAHHMSAAAPSQVEPEMLLKLAILIDKYHCGPVMTHQGELWLKRSKLDSRESIWSMMVFAYAINSEYWFQYCSSKLLVSYRAEVRSWDFAVNNLAFLPAKILDQLEKRRKSIYAGVHASLTYPITELARLLSDRCTEKKTLIGAYMENLHKADILPGTYTLNDTSCSKILEQAQQLPFYSYLCKNSKSGCHCFQFDGLAQRERVLSEINKCLPYRESGLCLPCFRNGECGEHFGGQ
ncbi:hypothetical protein BJY00DRAFT_317887 [Aspergillus carlsbadensis]|nr:hypothetical protein BJY00DRAFT_317887 [Aspergillus carlsbadensis]